MDGEIVKIELIKQLRERLALDILTGFAKAKSDKELMLCGREHIWIMLNESDLGFKLPKNWPLEGEVLLSQLIVLVHKLKCKSSSAISHWRR
ncbi:MAG: hypothetical protein ABSB91_00415 [Sedimentisphaerales bacterium]|jgi:hypothetical protein